MATIVDVGWDSGLKLSRDQQTRMNAIVDQSRKARWLLMGKMLDEQSALRDLYAAPKRDQAAIDASYARMHDLRKQMYGISVGEHKRSIHCLPASSANGCGTTDAKWKPLECGPA